jgi:Protein of unknown function (DUF4058)
MPIHDWSRLDAGVFRHFHNYWYMDIGDVLNEKLLPNTYFAMIEQTAGDVITDVLTLHAPTQNGHARGGAQGEGSSVAVAVMPPKVKTKVSLPRDHTVAPEKQLVIRHISGDRVVAIIEIVSRGNKSSEDEFQRFVFKAVEAIRQGIHLLVIDLQPPTSRDPHGIHGAIAARLGDHTYEAPEGKPLTVVSYVAMPIGTGYVEPVAVRDTLPEMPLFLDEGNYVNVPLEETYSTAFRRVPWRFKPELEATIQSLG